MSTAADTPAQLGTREVLTHYFWDYRRRMSIIPFCSFIAGMSDAAALVVLAQVALSLAAPDSAAPTLATFGIDGELTLGRGLIAIMALTAIRIFFQVVSAWAAAGVIAAVSVRARRNALNVFLDASHDSQSQLKQGALQQLLSEPVSRVSEMSSQVTKALTTLLNLTALLLSALLVDWRASVGLLLGGSLLFAALRPAVRLGRGFAGRERTAIANYATMVSEVEATALEVQVFDVTDTIRKESDAGLAELHAPLFRRNIVQPITPMMYQAAVITIAVAAMAVLMRVDSFDLAGLGAILLLVFKAMGHGQSFQGTWQKLQFTMPYAEQLQAAVVTHRSSPRPSGTVGLGHIDRIEAKDLGFAYDKTHVALHDLNFVIHAGQAVGIVGPSGAGKSTLLQLILRLREPTSGSLQVNGTNLNFISIADWYQRVAFVPQKSQLLQASIADNITFHRTGFSRQQIEEAGRLAGIHDEIMARPDGYDTQLGPRGSGLSGGQQQRIAIARALVGRPDLLVLDEPTSSLDAAAERAIATTLANLRGKITTIIVAHRPETVAHCDHIVTLTPFGHRQDAAAEEDRTTEHA